MPSRVERVGVTMMPTRRQDRSVRNPPRLRTSALLAVIVGATLLATASPAFAAATYVGTLAGPSVAATYPSGFEYDDVNDRLVLADTGLDRIEFYDYTIGGSPASSTFTKLPGQFGTHGTGNGQFDSPRDVAVDDTGNIYVADAGNNRVQSFTSAGVFRWTKGGTGTCNDCLNTPIGVTWDHANDVLLVASTGQDQVKAFSGTGTFLWSTTPGAASGPGGHRRPARRGPRPRRPDLGLGLPPPPGQGLQRHGGRRVAGRRRHPGERHLARLVSRRQRVGTRAARTTRTTWTGAWTARRPTFGHGQQPGRGGGTCPDPRRSRSRRSAGRARRRRTPAPTRPRTSARSTRCVGSRSILSAGC